MTSLYFDCAATRDMGKIDHKFATIREYWDCFINNCRRYCIPGTYVTLNEMLVPFCDRGYFQMYIRMKSAKYGPKIQYNVCAILKFLIRVKQNKYCAIFLS